MFEENAYYYTIGTDSTTDKLKAILIAEQTRQPIKFHIPEFLKSFPMHVEPEEDLKTLCVRHARRIRQDNDYLRLWFSGGCDSTYMLDIFVDNDIHVDEIVSTKSGIPEADWEIDQVAIPYIDSIKHKIPKTKISVLSQTINDYKDWYKNEYWFENYEKIGRSSKCFTGIRLNEKLEAINLHDNNQKTVNLVGLDKPFLIHVNNEWYTFFLDANVDFQEGTKDNKFCAFYNDDPMIYTKQCHLLMKTIVENLDVDEYNKVCMWEEKYQTLWNSSVGRLDKNNNFIIKRLCPDLEGIESLNYKEALGQKFIKENLPDIFKKFEDGIQNLNKIDNARWFNQNNAKLGSVGIFADFKSLEKNSTKTVDDLFPKGFKI